MNRNIKTLMVSFVGIMVLASPTNAGNFEKEVQEFQETATKHYNHQITLTDDQIRKLCADIGKQAVIHLKLHGVRSHLDSQKSEITVRIRRAGNSQFNHLARTTFQDTRASLRYDLTFLFHHPFAAASFDRHLNLLRLSHDSIIGANPDDASVKHELVHLNVWSDLLNKKPAPYYGLFDGKPFEPGPLYLDEMKAYRHDLQLAATSLKSEIESMPDPATVVKNSRIVEILTTRLAGQPPLSGLTAFEKIWDGLPKKVVHGRWHTDPAIAGLERVQEIMKEGIEPIFSVFHGLVRGIVKGTLNGETFSGTHYIVNSKSPKDPLNEEMFSKQNISALEYAFSIRDFWNHAEAKLRSAVIGSPAQVTVKMKRLEREIFSNQSPAGDPQ